MRQYFGNGFTEGANDYYYTNDHLGSIREVVASDGTTVESRYDYSPWGEVTRIDGVTNGVESDFLYTGHLYHSESDLFLTWFRAYDAEIGRWLSRDPIGFADGPNLYAYVGNDSINLRDPLGLFSWWDLTPFNNTADFNGFVNHGTSWDGIVGAAEGAQMGAAAYADGFIPIIDPFADHGVYDKCDKSLQASKALGIVAREAVISLSAAGLARAVTANAGYATSRQYLSMGFVKRSITNRLILAGFLANVTHTGGKLGQVQAAAGLIGQGISLYDSYNSVKDFITGNCNE